MKKRVLRRLMVLVLSGVLLFLLALPAGAETTERQRGDVDGNGRIEAIDALLVLRYVVGKYEISWENEIYANVDGFGTSSGFVNALDALWILKYIVWDKRGEVEIYFFTKGFDFQPIPGDLPE